jgi:hypothetical protein
MDVFKNKMGCEISEDAGLHLHVRTRMDDLDILKRMVTRYAQYENSIMNAFMPEERRSDKLFSSCAMLSYWGREDTTEEERNKAFVSFVAAVQSATSIEELNTIIKGRGNPMAIRPEYGTIEFRGPRATLSSKLLKNLVEFDIGFIISAETNNEVYFDSEKLQKAKNLRESDKSPIKTIGTDRYFFTKSNAYDPELSIPDSVLKGNMERYLRDVRENTSKQDPKMTEAVPDPRLVGAVNVETIAKNLQYKPYIVCEIRNKIEQNKRNYIEIHQI